MIKKAQIKFICIIMSILFGFFIAISCVTSMILQNSNNRNIDHILNDMVKIIPFANSDNTPANSLILKIYNNLDYQLIYVDSSIFSEEDIKLLILEIDSRPKTTGRIDDIYYKFVKVKNQFYLLAVDASDYSNELSTSLVQMILIYLIIYILLFVIVYLFSFSVFEPIKESFAKQQQFVSNASHELKTPLTIISANADVLKQRQDNQWTNNIKEQTERLEIIIADMLEMAKIDEGKPKQIKVEFNLSDEVIKTTLPFDSLAFEKGKILELDVTPNIMYNGDSESVKKILNILLDNSIKYASNDGLIKVSLRKKNRKNILSVYNTGSAVPSDQVDKIFERFYRFDNSRSRETGGSGLGLAIAKGISNANGWKISAISKPNEYMIINVIL